MNKKTILGITGILITASLIVAFLVQVKPGGGTEPEYNQAKLAETAVVTRGTVERVSEVSGVLEAGEECMASFEVPGRVIEMCFNIGDSVKKGEVLARVEATEYDLQITRAKSGYEKAQVGYRQAVEDFSRVEQLYTAGAVPLIDYENAQNRLTVAGEDLLEARASVALLEQDKTTLWSPIGGTVLAKLSSPGEMTGAGTPVYNIGRIDTLKVILPVPDRDISNWRVGQEVKLELYEQKRQGNVTRIHPATNRGTGTIGVEVTVANPERDWFPGQVVVSGRVETREGVYVPAGAIMNRGEEKPYVFIVVDGRAVKRSVTMGELFNDLMEVTSGLNSGDTLVVKGADRLFEGDEVLTPGGNSR